MADVSITPEMVREALLYDPQSGEFSWRKAARGRRSGARAGCRTAKGYVSINVGGRCVLAHRLAWLYVHGEWPKNQIDHLNGIRHDNRIDNLRDVSASMNNENRRANGSRLMRCGRHQAIIAVNGRQIGLGGYSTQEEARRAYIEAKRAMHHGCAHWEES